MEPHTCPATKRLIVNADDFGYSRDVSCGIIECARNGIVTATGVFGNSPDLADSVAMLAEAPALETGVHLSLSHGEPLTAAMRSALFPWGGRFPGKFAMAMLISRRRVGAALIRDELRAQVDACLARGMRIVFLNAHEHLHMHPAVFPVVCEIARSVGVRHVRITRPDIVGGGGAGGRVRNAIIRALAPRPVGGIEWGILFLGLARSGRIDFDYLQKAFGLMVEGGTYELMCHPGFPDPVLSRDERLRKYHDWDLERRSLQDERLPALMQRHGIKLARFSDAQGRADRSVERSSRSAPG